jgi:hypothetical protein
MPLDMAGRGEQLSLMNLWLPTILSCCLLAGCASSPPTEDAARKAPAASQAAGNYAGQWTSSEGATGNLQVTLKKPADSPWQGNVSFTFEGDTASTTMKSVEVNDNHVLFNFEYEVRGGTGAVEMTGELAGDSLQDSYKVTRGDGNPGSWKVSRNQ